MKSLFEYYKNVLFPNDDFKNRVAYYTRLVCNKRLPINLTLKGESFTDSRMIYISMNEQEGAENSALSIDFIDTPDVARLYVYGLAVHEAEHVNSSNFEYFEKFIKKVEYALNGTDIELSPYQCNKIGRFIANALEDGRIERRAKVRLPGTKKFLYLLNYNLMYQHECSGSVATDLLNNILCLSKTGVFLKGTVELYESDKEMKDVLLKIRPLIKKAVECDNPIKIYDYAWEIFLICCPIIEKYNEEQGTEEEDMKNLLNSKEANEESFRDTNNTKNDCVGGNQEISGQESEFGESEGNGSKKDSKNQFGKRSESDKEQSEEQKDGSFVSEEDFNDSTQKMYKERKESLKKEMEDLINQDKKNTQSVNPPQKHSQLKGEAEKLTKDEIKDIMSSNSRFYINDVSSYKKGTAPIEIKMKARKLQKELLKIIADKKSERLYSQKRGRLDSKKYTSAISSQNKNIFYKSEIKDVDDAVFYLILDNSGSMAGKKFEKAMEIASLIEETLRGIVHFKIIGYDESIFVLREFNDMNKLSVFSIPECDYRPRAGTCDAMALTYALRELVKQRERKKVCFIVSDGSPNVIFSKKERCVIDECKKVVKEFERNGVHLVSIGLEIDNYSLQTFKDIYGRKVIFRNTDNIEKQLIKYIGEIFAD